MCNGTKTRFWQEIQQRLAGHLLGDHPGDDVVRVAVLPLRARVEVERLLGPAGRDLGGRDRLQHHGHDVVLRPEILVAGCHREDLANGDVTRAREVGQPSDDFVIERELSFFGEEDQRGGGELLADRADRIAHLRRCRQLRLEVGNAVRVRVDDLAVADCGHRGAGRAGLGQDVGGGFVDAGPHVGGELLRVQGGGEGECEEGEDDVAHGSGF